MLALVKLARQVGTATYDTGRLLWMGFQIRVILGVPQKWAYIMQTQMFPFSSWLTLFCFINTIARGDRHEERF